MFVARFLLAIKGLPETLDGDLVPHSVVVGPDALLHHPELSLPQLLVHADALGLDEVLRRHLQKILLQVVLKDLNQF